MWISRPAVLTGISTIYMATAGRKTVKTAKNGKSSYRKRPRNVVFSFSARKVEKRPYPHNAGFLTVFQRGKRVKTRKVENSRWEGNNSLFFSFLLAQKRRFSAKSRKAATCPESSRHVDSQHLAGLGKRLEKAVFKEKTAKTN